MPSKRSLQAEVEELRGLLRSFAMVVDSLVDASTDLTWAVLDGVNYDRDLPDAVLAAADEVRAYEQLIAAKTVLAEVTGEPKDLVPTLSAAWRATKDVLTVGAAGATLWMAVQMNLGEDHPSVVKVEEAQREALAKCVQVRSEIRIGTLVLTSAVEDETAIEALILREAFAFLPERSRRALELSFFEDMPTAEIAEVMEIPTGSVKSHLRRGLDMLRATLAESEMLKPPAEAAQEDE